MKNNIKTVRVKFDKLKGETAKAVLLQFGSTEHWFPKKMCWQFITNKKLGGNCVIPAWLYVEKFGEQPDETMAETVVEHHVPVKLEPVQSIPDGSLTRPTE